MTAPQDELTAIRYQLREQDRQLTDLMSRYLQLLARVQILESGMFIEEYNSGIPGRKIN